MSNVDVKDETRAPTTSGARLYEIARRHVSEAASEIGAHARAVMIVAVEDDQHTRGFAFEYIGPCASAEGLVHILQRRLVRSFPDDYR